MHCFSTVLAQLLNIKAVGSQTSDHVEKRKAPQKIQYSEQVGQRRYYKYWARYWKKQHGNNPKPPGKQICNETGNDRGPLAFLQLRLSPQEDLKSQSSYGAQHTTRRYSSTYRDSLRKANLLIRAPTLDEQRLDKPQDTVIVENVPDQM